MAIPDDKPRKRINARLDERRSAKLESLLRSGDMGVSDVVKRGIDLVYEEKRRRAGNAWEVLSKSGFIGAGSGPEDLSERYKEALTESLESKHGDR